MDGTELPAKIECAQTIVEELIREYVNTENAFAEKDSQELIVL